MSWSRDPFFEGQNLQNLLKSAMCSIAIIDQHKILFPMIYNTIEFAKETNLSFISWSRDAFFEGQ